MTPSPPSSSHLLSNLTADRQTDGARTRAFRPDWPLRFPPHHLPAVHLSLSKGISSHHPLIPTSPKGREEEFWGDCLPVSSSPGKSDFLRETEIHRSVNTHGIPEEEGEGCSQLPSTHAPATCWHHSFFHPGPGTENLPGLACPSPRHPFSFPF